MRGKIGIPLEVLDKIIKTIKINKKIEEIILFGSRAKNSFKPGSDIDIAIIANDISYNELNQIRVDINELLLPYYVDIVDYNRITNDSLKDHISRVGQVFKP